MTESCTSMPRREKRLAKLPTAFVQVCCLAIVTLLISVVSGRADEQEREYLRIYENIQQADSLDTGGKTSAALTKYQQAHADLVKFRKAYPTWNKDMVLFRLNYVAEKAAACNEKLLAASAAAPSTNVVTNATGQGQASASQSQTKAAPTIEQPLVKLLEPGAEPRKALKLHPKAGEKQTVTLTVKTKMEGKGQGQGMEVPPLVITLETTVKEVSADGDISYENVIADAAAGGEPAGSQPGMAAAMNAAFAGLKGLTTSGVLSDRGFSKRKDPPRGKSGEKQQPAAARLLQGQMDTSLTMLTAPLPEEPVGAGAKWEVKMTDKSMGIAKAVYEIVKIEDERLVAKTTVAVAATPPAGGSQSPLGNMKIDGTGEVTIDLTRIMPTAGTLVQTMEIGAPAKGGAPAAAGMGGKVVTDLRIESK